MEKERLQDERGKTDNPEGLDEIHEQSPGCCLLTVVRTYSSHKCRAKAIEKGDFTVRKAIHVNVICAMAGLFESNGT